MNAATIQPPGSERLEQLDAILQASLAMLDVARTQDWEQLDLLEGQRREQVAVCFRIPTPAEEAAAVASYIHRILEVNQEITLLAEAGRQDARQCVHLLSTGKSACKAYGKHTR